MEKYIKEGSGEVVQLVAESPDGNHVMLQYEGDHLKRWVITSEEFHTSYKRLAKSKEALDF